MQAVLVFELSLLQNAGIVKKYFFGLGHAAFLVLLVINDLSCQKIAFFPEAPCGRVCRCLRFLTG